MCMMIRIISGHFGVFPSVSGAAAGTTFLDACCSCSKQRERPARQQQGAAGDCERTRDSGGLRFERVDERSANRFFFGTKTDSE